MGRVTNVLLEFGSLEKNRRLIFNDKTATEKTIRDTKVRKVGTFLQTGEAEELNEAEVVPANEHGSSVIGIDGVDLG